jgi:hypothetical protein
MRKVLFIFLCLLSFGSLQAQMNDSLLIGDWDLIKIIDNFTGDEILPAKKKADFQYTISFYEDSLVKFNLEVNKCRNSYILPQKNQIKFLYYAECTKICCDKEFSELLMYEECTNYYIKNGNVLVLVSEDRIYYFSRKTE